jgi:hypothetical protein
MKATQVTTTLSQAGPTAFFGWAIVLPLTALCAWLLWMTDDMPAMAATCTLLLVLPTLICCLSFMFNEWWAANESRKDQHEIDLRKRFIQEICWLLDSLDMQAVSDQLNDLEVQIGLDAVSAWTELLPESSHAPPAILSLWTTKKKFFGLRPSPGLDTFEYVKDLFEKSNLLLFDEEVLKAKRLEHGSATSWMSHACQRQCDLGRATKKLSAARQAVAIITKEKEKMEMAAACEKRKVAAAHLLKRTPCDT